MSPCRHFRIFVTKKNIPNRTTDNLAGGVESIEQRDGDVYDEPKGRKTRPAGQPYTAAVAVVGRPGPGVIATVLSGLAAGYFLIEPSGTFDIANPAKWLSAGIFVANGIAVSVITWRVHQSRAPLASSRLCSSRFASQNFAKPLPHFRQPRTRPFPWAIHQQVG